MKEKNKDKIRVSVWLSEAENEKLKLSAKLCGLSESEFVRQLCKGKTPKPQPTKEFWEMLEAIPISQYKDHYRSSTTSVNGVWQCIEVKCLTDIRAIAVYTAGRTFPLYAAPILWKND